MKKTVRVIRETEVEIELTEKVLGGMTEEQYLTEFRSSLWHVDSMDDVIQYAAAEAAMGCTRVQLDGLGIIDHAECSPDVIYRIVSEETEAEIL